MKGLMLKIFEWKTYLSKELWEVDTSSLKRSKRLGIHALKVGLLSARAFIADKCALRASALTFYSLLSIVPILAVAFGIAKGFGLEEILDEQIRQSFAGQQEVIEKAIEFSHSSLQTTQGGLIAGVSILFLLWSVIKLLNHVENAFNRVWNLEKSRSFIRKFTDYLTLVLISPVFIVLSGSVTVFINTKLNHLQEEGMFFEFTGSLLLSLMQLAPFASLWILFTLLYMIMPNKNIRFVPALIAGIIGGSLFALMQNGYVYFQIAMSRYNTIYGSFAALPLFLIWLQVSWMIILYGAEISYALSHLKDKLHLNEDRELSIRDKRLAAVYLLKFIALGFKKGEGPFTANDLAENLRLPIVMTKDLLHMMKNSGLLLSLQDKKGRLSYTPALDLNELSVGNAIDMIDEQGEFELNLPSEDFRELKEQFFQLINPVDGQAYKTPISKL